MHKKILIGLFLLCSISIYAENALIIDVRSDEEFQAGHVEGAIHIPYQEIGEKIGAYTHNKSQDIIVYCARGGRAGKAQATLQSLGYNAVENGGGLSDMLKRFPSPKN